MNNVIFKAHKLRKDYEEFSLDIESVSLEEGKIYAVLGPNGSGKTTLLRILALLEKVTSGEMYFWGKEITNKSYTDCSLRRNITMVMQEPYFFDTSVYNNLALGLKVRKLEKAHIERRITESLDMVGLGGLSKEKTSSLSGGQVQRLAVARAVALKTPFLILDEPVKSVDKQYTEVLENLIRNLKRERITVIFASHDTYRANTLADEIIYLVEGKILEFVPENIFKGEICKGKGLKWIDVVAGLKIYFLTNKTGSGYISVDSRDIIVSLRKISSSARNSFSGRIVKITKQNEIVRLFVNIGIEMVAQITTHSFEEMRLNIGSDVYLTFKASSVQVF